MKYYKKLQKDLAEFTEKEARELSEKLNAPKRALEFHRDDGIGSRGVLNSPDAGISHAGFDYFGGLHARIESQHLNEFLCWLQEMLHEPFE